ncbi:MAG TPA: erythromycin esterase family protein [Nevskiaceae bacterium]|nr:erythromycin esterase family protein [Nevskiaceae bacterium]
MGNGEAIRAMTHPLREVAQDYDALLDWIGDAEVVLIGEASHGTHEFYRERAAITRRLIEEKGFRAVAAEADWPDAWRVNRFVHGRGTDVRANDALRGFQRFPAWMWRNTVMLEFVDWLRAHNRRAQDDRCAGFYGIDLYSLHSSISAVIGYLERIDPSAARRARDRYACFDHVGTDPQSYGYLAHFNVGRSCEDAVVRQLTELLERSQKYAARDGAHPRDDFFDAAVNARVVRNAEQYYRAMFRSHAESWNLRDRHMMETLVALKGHLEAAGDGPARIVVWAHNSHLGDARATDMSRGGELNLGQLVREHFDARAYAIGFSTYEGTVTAAHDWGEAAETMRVRPGLAGSYEALFHEAGMRGLLLNLRELAEHALLRGPRLQRAIGVIYRPHTERLSHYFEARLSQQFDAMIHIDTTRALHPLEHTARVAPLEETETYPSGA